MGVTDVRGTTTPSPAPRRAKRVALALVAIAVVLAAGGALSFRRFVQRVQSDPGFTYRDAATFEKLLKRARDAEGHGDRGTATATYRFIVAVGAKGDSTLEPYVTAARAGLERLAPGTLDTPPGRAR